MPSTPDVPRNNTPGSRSRPTWRKKLVSSLTTVSHVSAPFITAFALIHLSAPSVGIIGGSSLSSQVMLLGREYYQAPFGERYLVLAPLVIHPLSSITKRLFSLGIGFQEPLPQPRSITSTLSSTAYSTLFLFLPVHYLTHRIYPTISDAPIHSFGPAELDYEFVKTGLQNWPWRSWFLYIGLVGCVLLHSVEGVSVITTTWFGKSIVPKNKRKLVSLIAGIPALTGLYLISREMVWALASSVESYVNAFSRSVMYRLL